MKKLIRLFFLPLILTTTSALGQSSSKVHLDDVENEVIFLSDECPEQFEKYQSLKTMPVSYLKGKEIQFQSFSTQEHVEDELKKEGMTKMKLINEIYSNQVNSKNESLFMDKSVFYVPSILVEDFRKGKRETEIQYIGEDKKSPDYILISIEPKERKTPVAYVFNFGVYDENNRPTAQEKTLIISSCSGYQNILVKVTENQKLFLEHSEILKIKKNEKHEGQYVAL